MPLNSVVRAVHDVHSSHIINRGDLAMTEHKQSLDECLKEQDVHITSDNIVRWNSNSKSHPLNWKPWSKFYTTSIVIWLEFYMTALSSSGAATAKAAKNNIGLSTELMVFGSVSVYLLGQTIGGIFCSPISEFFGRRTIYILANASFGVSSVLVAAPGNAAGMFLGRFLQGICAAIPATVAFGNFSDLFDAEVRIWIVYAYTLLGMSGLALGPIYATYVSATIGWKWVYYIAAIASAVTAVACFFMKESNASQLLERRTKEVQEQTGDKKLKPDVDSAQSENPISDFLTNNIYQPVRFIFTEPLVCLCAILCATAFGLIYGLTESLSIVYTTPPFDKTFNENSSSLSFLAILVGEILNIFPRFYDAQVIKQQRRYKLHILPETKIHSFGVACPALAIGLWIFAWTIPQQITTISWPISMTGLVCVGFAANDFSYVLFGYITDSYGFYAASAVAVLSTARTLAAAVFPLFVSQMYKGLGNNIATTIFAAVATAFCFTPFLFLQHGATLRKKSKWAASGDDVLKDENEHMREGSDSGDGEDGMQMDERC